MSSRNGQAKQSRNKKVSAPDVEIHVAPGDGKASRTVVARWGDKEFTDVLDPLRASARVRFVKALAEAWGIDDVNELNPVKDLLSKRAQEADALAVRDAEEAANRSGPGLAEDRSARALESTPPAIIAAAKAFLSKPDLLDELADDLKKLGIAGEIQLAKTEFLIGVSRKLDRPLGGSVKSSSSSGKSYVLEIVASLMPEEDVLAATDITANALYYLPPDSLRHKLVVVGERKHMNSGDEADGANATLALREMMSRGRLDKYVPVKNEHGLETRHISQEGPIAYLETTTQQDIFEEDATRMLSLATDESREQTEAIMEIQAKQAAWTTASVEEQETIRGKHRTAQRLLSPRRVRISYAPRLALPASRLVTRRAFPQLLGAIEAVAQLRQFQKTVHEDGHIEADLVDYEIAYGLMLPVLGRTYAPLGQRAEALLAAIQAHALPDRIFTRSDCATWAGVGTTEVRNRLTLLVEAGMVEQVSGAKGIRYTYKVMSRQVTKAPALAELITPEELRRQLEE